MKRVNCVKCGHVVEIDISKAVDERGEEFRCPYCGFIFRFVDK